MTFAHRDAGVAAGDLRPLRGWVLVDVSVLVGISVAVAVSVAVATAVGVSVAVGVSTTIRAAHDNV